MTCDILINLIKMANITIFGLQINTGNTIGKERKIHEIVQNNAVFH